MVVFRIAVSALLVALISFGNGLQTLIAEGKIPTKWELIAVGIPALVLALNDVKSRITPAPVRNGHAS